MSEPVTNVEIEDVLSSIRRLVSEGDWARPSGEGSSEAAEAPAQTRASPSIVEKFVLTPALRVAGAGRESEAEEQEELSDDVSEQPSLATEEAPIDVATEAEPDPEPFPQFEHRRFDIGSEQTEPEVADASADTAAQRASLEGKIAALEAAVSGQADEWEPDGSEEAEVAPEWTVPEPTSRRPRPVEAEDAETVDEVVAESGISPEDVPTEDTISQEYLDELSEDLTGEDGGQTYGSDLDGNLNDYLGDASVVDEETLRKLVAEVVHQELQGALGERITRNVRKLVRREIYRILASQEFQ